MKVEIEAKVAIEDMDAVADALRQAGAEHVAYLRHRDVFFGNKKGKSIKAGCGLRLRQQQGQGADKVFLTFKGPRQRAEYKTRDESEVAVADADAMAEILIALGYEQILVVEKKRGLWRLGECEVCLDEVALLGRFVEVEGPSEQAIRQVLERLGLDDREHIDDGYAKMVRKRLKEMRAEKMEAVFQE